MVNQYKYKFYLNANHAIFINNVLGQMHPHTWEIMIEVLSTKENFVQFDRVEAAISKLLEKYQDQFINTVDPFDKVNPTLENVVYYFKQMIEEQIKEYYMVLLSIEISETPSRSYIINSYDEVEEKYLSMNKFTNDEENFINQIVRQNLTEEAKDIEEGAEAEEAAVTRETVEDTHKTNCSCDCMRNIPKQVKIVTLLLLVFAICYQLIKNHKIKQARKDVLDLLGSYDDITFTRRQE